VTLSGFVANPMHSRATGRMQYLFLNGRAIRDRALQHALCEAYRGLMLTGRQPICFLRLDMPAEMVDVNVHPTKQEVRFQDSGRLYSQLLGTLRTRFLTTDLTARGTTHTAFAAPAEEDAATSNGPSELVAWAKEQLGKQMASRHDELLATKPDHHALVDSKPVVNEPLRLHRIDVPAFKPFDIGGPPAMRPSFTSDDDQPAMARTAEEATSQPTAPPWGRSHSNHHRNALQVHNRYLVVETIDGIEVIDQHALHERILYEQIREKVLSGALEAQKLLVPEPVDLTAHEAATVLEHAELLAQLGVEVQPFGGETVLVSSYPAMLANLSPVEVLHELVEKLLSGGRAPEPRDLLDDLLHMIACKAAVKFGDRLSPEEIEALLEQRHLAQDQHHCPHGRPTALVFTREDLDRQFKRI
jgi:DNA mismatch repair protein MutL